MITLLIDAAIAAVKLIDRGFGAVEQSVRHRVPMPVAGARPAGAGGLPPSATGTGGHPIEPTSELLNAAAWEIQALGRMAYSATQPWIEGFAAELRDRAAQFAACGD